MDTSWASPTRRLTPQLRRHPNMARVDSRRTTTATLARIRPRRCRFRGAHHALPAPQSSSGSPLTFLVRFTSSARRSANSRVLIWLAGVPGDVAPPRVASRALAREQTGSRLRGPVGRSLTAVPVRVPFAPAAVRHRWAVDRSVTMSRKSARSPTFHTRTTGRGNGPWAGK